jgi:xylan 1,4-beta-xylosidase
MKPICLLLLVLLLAGMNASAQNVPAVMHVNLEQSRGEMKPIWAWYGYDEPNFTYMKDGRKLLTELAALSPVPVYVRTHNLLTSGDGVPALKWGSTNIYTEDTKGNPVYNYHTALCRRLYRHIHNPTSTTGNRALIMPL